MEKRAEHIKSAGTKLKTAIKAANAESQHNINVAIHNRNVFFTQEGEAQPYKNAAFLSMIQVANTLIGVALEDE